MKGGEANAQMGAIQNLGVQYAVGRFFICQVIYKLPLQFQHGSSLFVADEIVASQDNFLVKIDNIQLGDV